MQVIEIDCCDLSSLCASNTRRYPFLLESVTHSTSTLNKYSILFAFPGETIKSHHKNDDFLGRLQSKKTTQNPLNLPFIGGYFVYLSYELITQLENFLSTIPADDTLIAQATYIPVAIIMDLSQNKTYIVDEGNDDFRIKKILNDINDISNTKSITDPIENQIITDDENIFLKNIEVAKKYIKAGDIFQVNLARNWHVELTSNITDSVIYNLLKQCNPAPFAAFAKLDEFTIISSSPERLFSVSDGLIQTHPIAGTRPRGGDDKLKNELKKNLKERAEHLMLLDLERNDLGRVCEYGSIEVNEMMVIESYEFVHHIVSNIKGKLKTEITFSDIIKALFPGGTITGCPKIRSMQIIAELEKTTRGAYTGSLGYISNCGKMDFNILIRTMVKNQNSICFKAGAGIVFDSIADNELQETEHKALGMIAVFSNKTLTRSI